MLDFLTYFLKIKTKKAIPTQNDRAGKLFFTAHTVILLSYGLAVLN